MGLFSSRKVFKTKQQIRDALFQIKSLDYRQQPSVFEALIKELDDGGVSTEELKKVIRELRNNGEISEIDQQNLSQLIKD